MSPNFPKLEFSKEKLVIRNMPKSNCYKKLAKAFLLSSEICESENDIIELESGIMIAKRKTVDCGCGCQDTKQAVGPQKVNKLNNQKNIDNCKYWCDKCALGRIAWCAKVFKRWDCQTGCIFAVDLIKDGCHWCCSGGNFYKKCVEPFEDIVSYIEQPCDPYWD